VNSATSIFLNPDWLRMEPGLEREVFDASVNKENHVMPIILWLLGVPLSVIILLLLFGFLR
jgi:hypothetical protein